METLKMFNEITTRLDLQTSLRGNEQEEMFQA